MQRGPVFYLDEKLKESSHPFNLAPQLLCGGVEGAGGGPQAPQPVCRRKNCTLKGCSGAEQLSLGRGVAHKHCRRTENRTHTGHGRLPSPGHLNQLV